MDKTDFKMIFCIFFPLLVLVFVFLTGYPLSNAAFMKGPLAAKHAYLKNDCKACHKPWEGVIDSLCIKCHVDDRHYIDNVSETEAKKLRCFDCHHEHRGRSFDPEVSEHIPLKPKEVFYPE